MIDILIITISVVSFSLVLIWWLRPDLRAWMEKPKYDMLARERKFKDSSGADAASPPDT